MVISVYADSEGGGIVVRGSFQEDAKSAAENREQFAKISKAPAALRGSG
jgi:hypothetical protein